ncbi:glycosyltransferase family 4 protein [Gracilimonas sp. Q87]|uniref:glycosyltransferase family 4 protein n=1 Tax=Gracilimonas sp. Q87 TaxID=3384766 RepID=UPI003983E9D9
MDTVLIQILAGTVITFFIAYLTIPILRKVAYKTDLYDKPDNDRKLHTRYVPSLGGVAIFLAFFVGLSVSGMADHITGYPYLAAGLLLLFFTGLKDDIVDLSAKTKLGVELLVAAFLIFGCGVYIDNFYGVFGIYEIPFWLSIAVSTFTMIVVMNSYNLIDGIDGLAGGVGLIASVFFGWGFLIAGELAMATLSLMLCSALAAFMIYNFNPASIFMGDTGSLVVGLLLSVLAINFVGLNGNESFIATFGSISPILPVAILSIPLFDTLTVFYKRVSRGNSPFDPGQDHIHHSILKAGFGHKSTAFMLYGANIGIVLFTLTLGYFAIDINLIFASTVIIMFVLLPTNGFKRKYLRKIGLIPERLDIESLQYSAPTKTDNKSSEGQTNSKAKAGV